MNQLLGQLNKIQIITNSDIRYEGVMYQINTQDQTIALSNVVSFGTEGRRPANEIAPSSVVYEYIVFRGTDIKDIVALDQTQNQQQQTKQQPISQPPEITKKQDEPIQPKKIENKSDEIDIELMNQQFVRNKDEDEKVQIEPKYNKKSFFDDISTSVSKKERETREEYQHQQEINNDTFGSEYVKQNEMMSQMFRNNNNYKRGRGGNQYQNNRGGNRQYQQYRGGQQRYNNYQGNYNNRNDRQQDYREQREDQNDRQNNNNTNQEGQNDRQNNNNRNYEGQNNNNRNYEGQNNNRNYEGKYNNNRNYNDLGYQRKAQDNKVLRNQTQQYEKKGDQPSSRILDIIDNAEQKEDYNQQNN